MNTTVPTSQLVLATWNIGNGTVADARGIMRRGVSALALQEASDQRELVDALVDDGFVAIRPDKAGQPATPLVYDPSVLEPDEELTVLTAAKQNIGPGTGPSVMKAKWLIGAHFVHLPSRRRIAIASHHRVAGQNDNPRRHQIAVEDARKVAEEFHGYRGLVVVMGDWNAKAKDETLAPMRRRRWTSNQLVGGKVPTHGKWAPDHVWWKRADRIAFVRHEAIPGTRSDHRPLLVTLAITHRT